MGRILQEAVVFVPELWKMNLLTKALKNLSVKKFFQLEKFFTPKPNWPLHFILEIKEGIPNLHLL
jgi:hypothetical protein